MTFESPLLPVHEIVAGLREFSIIVSDQDFRQPDPRKWREIYSTVYEALSGRSIETAIQSVLKVTRINSTAPEAFEEAAAQTAFTQCLQRVLSGSGYKGFSLKDVIHPTPKAVRRMASVFLNRYRHDMRVLNFFDETRERAQKSLGEYESVLKRKEELKQRQQADEDNHVHRKAELQKTEDEVEEKDKLLAGLQTAAEEEKGSVQDLKLKISGEESSKAAMKQVVEQKAQECENLSKKIVQSPGKFQVDLDRLKSKVTDNKSQLNKQERVLSDAKLLLERTMKNVDTAAKSVKLSTEVQADFDKDTEISADIQRLTEKQSDLQEAMNSCYPHEEDLEERFGVRQSKLHTLKSHSDLRQQTSLQKTADLKQYSEKLKENLKSQANEISSVRDVSAQLRLKVSEVEDWVEAEREDLDKTQQRMIQMMDVLDETSEQSLARVREIFES